VLIRIRRVGICGTDFHIFRGKQPFLSYPRLIGHEFSGEVAEAPGNSGLAVGDRVAVMPYLPVGPASRAEEEKPIAVRDSKCSASIATGALTEYVSVPAAVRRQDERPQL